MNELTGTRVSVVGATGFIGSHLVEHLLLSGAEVLAVASTELRRANLRQPKQHYLFATCDIAATADLTNLLRCFRPSIVFHLASCTDGVETFEQMESCLTVNAIGTLRVLEASHAAGVHRFVYGGSSKIYGAHDVPSSIATPSNPLSSYAIGKSAGWQLCKLYGVTRQMAVAALHPSIIYGPRQSWNLVRYVQDCVDRNEVVRLQGGEQTRDPLYIGDAVRAYVAAAIRPSAIGHSIPIGGGREIAVADFTQKILEALGHPDWPVECGGQPPRATEMWRNYTSNADAARLLGWQPEVVLEEGLRLTVKRPGWTSTSVIAAANGNGRTL